MPQPSYSPRQDPLLIGASWYPEMWPESEWPKDLARMRELGFNLVRMFEFAWHRFEPQAGQFDTAWAVRLLDLCHAHGIAVQIGTPTAAPPAWLSTAWPEILHTGPDGKQDGHGRRRHINHHSRKYRELAAAIVGRMVEDLGTHPAVHSWQIDNEMNGMDYGQETRRLFHAWLRQRYGTVEGLNRRWGLEFWSQAYADFTQVPLCIASVGSIEVPERHHPSLILAIAGFQNEAWTSFIGEQCAIIRRRSGKPISTNMTGFIGAMDWFAHNRQLDRVGASIYSDRRYYDHNLVRFDRMRAEKREPYWLLETAPNWSAGGRTWNIHFDNRGPRLMSFLNIFLGGEMVLFWQWREHWAGQEMLHGTCVTATGRWRPNKEAWTALASEFARHGSWLQAHPPQQPELAVLIDNQAAWAFSIDPTDEKMDYPSNIRDQIHRPLATRQLWRDLIHPTADFTPYRVLCLPLLPQVDAATRQRLDAWVRAGGTLLLGPLTGFRSDDFTAFTDHEFGGFEDLIGGDSLLRHTVQWLEDVVRVEFTDGALAGHTARCRTMGDSFTPRPGTAALAYWRGGYADGQPAVLDHRHGKGRVITLGAVMDADSYGKIVAQACADAGIAPMAAADQKVVIAPRADAQGRLAGWGLCNISDQPQEVRLPKGGTDLLSGSSCPDGRVVLEPWGVALVAC